MGKVFEAIDAKMERWLTAQKMFFVATAPVGDDGHVNLSPKGLDTFAVLGPTTVAYLDLTGSGAETIAHLRQNGRICLMFCAFEGAPRIVRIHGEGEALLPDHPEFARSMLRFPDLPGVRSIIRVEASRLSDSCGYSVPLYEFKGHRDQLTRWAEHKGPEGLIAYRTKRNATSLDGLPALETPDEMRDIPLAGE
jgi:hypothetical protein